MSITIYIYMLGLAAICWSIWKARNRTCFEKKHINCPSEVLYSACIFMRYWAGLYLEETQKMINAGVDLMMKTVMRLLGKQDGGATTLLVKDATEDDEEKDEGAQAREPHGGEE
jgi:hypothetical protein